MISMKRGVKLGDTIKELKDKLKAAEKSKKEYSNYLKRLEENYHKGKISYARYVEILYQKREGRNLKEWIGYLDKYDKNCRKEIQRQKRKTNARNIGLIFLSLAIIFVLFTTISSNFKFSFGSFTGFVIGGNITEENATVNETIPEANVTVEENISNETIVQNITNPEINATANETSSNETIIQNKILGGPYLGLDILPNASNQAWNGTFNEMTFTVYRVSKINSNDLSKIIAKDNNPFWVPGNTSSYDGFLFVNFTIPSNCLTINVTVWANITSTSSTSNMSLGLWNFSAGSGAWKRMTGAASTTNTIMSTYVSGSTLLSNFVSGNQIRAIVYESSSASRQLRVDYIGINVTLADISYPIFSNYWDNNGSLAESGTGLFNVTLSNTNGTVWLEINGQNITATNKSGSATVFNATYTFINNGTYSYKWHSWGNGDSHNYNVSNTRSYTVNATASDTTPPDVTIISPENREYHIHTELPITFNVSLSENGSVMYSLDGGENNFSMSSTDNINFNATNDSMDLGNYTFTVYANDTAGNKNWTESMNFSFIMENMLINGTVNAADGSDVNSTIVIYNEITDDYVYNETGTNNSAIVPLNSTYTIEVIPHDVESVDKIEFNNINFTEQDAGLSVGIVDVDEATGINNYSKVFSIRPKLNKFSNATIIFTAKANAIQKCANWSYSEKRCLTNWDSFMNDLSIGESYSFNLNEDGYDSVAYGIVEITNARHLDENKSFISNIFDQVKARDDIWSETIPSGDYVRVTFEDNLTNKNDITLFPRIISGSPKIEVYEVDGADLITEFSSIQNNTYNKVYLTNLTGNQDTFDLKISGGSIQFDHIIDPSITRTYYLWNASGRKLNLTSYPSATTIVKENLTNSTAKSNAGGWNWTAISFYNVSTMLVNTTAATLVIFCNSTNKTSAPAYWANITKVEIYDCGTSSTCAGGSVIWTNSSPRGAYYGTARGSCNSSARNHNITVTFGIGPNYTMTAGEYLGIGIYVNVSNATINIWYNGSNTNSRFSVTEVNNVIPNINITYPQNATNTTNTLIDVNYTVLDDNNIVNLNCWYSNSSGKANYSLANCSTNITGRNWLQGINNVTIWVNDTFNNLNWSSVTFTVDTRPPYFTNLANQSIYTNQSLSYNMTAIDSNVGLDSFAINWTNAFSITKGGNLTNTSGLSAGNYYINVSINDTLNNLNSTILLINVTFVAAPDTTPPYFTTIPANASINYNFPLSVIFAAADETLFGSYKVNDSRFVINTTGGLKNNTVLGVGIYIMNVSINDTVGNSNSTMYRVDVNQIASQTSLTFDKATPQTYPSAITPTCSVITGQGTPTLSNATSGSPITLGVGTWTINCSLASSQNYTASSNTTNYVISQNTTYILSIAKTTPITYPATTDFSGSGCPSQLTCSLNISNGIYGAGTIYANYSANGNTNYSAKSTIDSITINQNSTPCNIYFNATSPLSYPQIFGVFTNCSTPYTIYRNGTSITNSSVQSLGAGANYNFTVLRTDNTNYSNTKSNATFTINQNTTLILGLTATTPITYPTATNFAGSGCPSELTCSLNISNGIYAAGAISANYSTAGNTNYSAKSATYSVTINQNTSAVVYTYLNNSRSNITIYNNTAIYLNATLSNVSGTLNLYNNGTLINTGTSPLSNLTSFNATGIYNITGVYSGNTNYSSASESWWVNVTPVPDITNPSISITYPSSNNTNTSNTQINVNYTVSDNVGVGSCWYSNSSGIVNYSLGTNCANITGRTWLEGINNVTIWVNDTTGNQNNSKITFTVDTIPPKITKIIPLDYYNYSRTNMEFNISLDEVGNLCQFTLNNGVTNYTMTPFNDTYFNYTNTSIADGNYLAKYWCNDSLNNINNTETVNFTIDDTPPEISIIYPTNNTNTNNAQLNVNYTHGDASYCWYSNDSYSVNSTPDSNCANLTTITWSDGQHNVIVWGNDSLNNVNYSSITFTVDATSPNINFTNPTPSDASTQSGNSIYVNVSSNDTNDHSVWIDWNRSLIGYWSFDSINSSGTVFDNSTYGNNGTVASAIYVTGARGNAYSFTGSSTMIVNITTTLSNLTGYNYTLSAWIKPGLMTALKTAVSKMYVFELDRDSANNRTLCAIGNGTAWITPYAYSPTYTPDQWHHVICSYNGTSLVAYLDGVAGTPATNKGPMGNNSQRLLIGRSTTGYYWNGSVDEVQVYSRALSSQEIKALYNASAYQYYNNFTNLSSGNYNFTAYAIDEIGNVNSTETRSITISSGGGNNTPIITTIYNYTTAAILNMGPYSTGVSLNFTAYDEDGDLNDSAAKINLSMSGEITRENISCYKYESSANYANYSCNITMWWFDGAGSWNITASISDNNSNFVSNSSSLYVGANTGFDLSPSNLTWNAFSRGSTNQTASNNPLTLNNTGNQAIGTGDVSLTGNISINATDLIGEADSGKRLFANNFSVGLNSGAEGSCGGGTAGNLSTGTYVNITSATLSKGNYTKNDGTGQAKLYFCLRATGSDLTSQAYSTLNQGAWMIKIFLVAFIPASRKNKKKNRSLKDDKLLEAFNLISDKLKEEYSLNKIELLEVIIEKLKSRYNINRKEILELIKSEEEIKIPLAIFSKGLGCLEAISKYMKENLNMNYRDISEELGRNERTVWTSYKKAKEKQKEFFSKEEKGILIPVSIFKNNKLTILESIILYLKEKGMKYSEIGKLLNRDQRNIRTIYIRMLSKR